MKDAVIINAQQLNNRACRSVVLLGFVIAWLMPANVTAQSIVLAKSDIERTLTDMRIKEPVIVLDNLNIHMFGNKSTAQEAHQSTVLTKLLLTVLTQRLVQKDAFDLSTPVSNIIPQVIAANPFEKSITFQHLLQETAGFATPPKVLAKGERKELINADRLKKFAIKLRSPSQLSVHDPVGWAVLIRAIETIYGVPLQKIITQHFIEPIGLTDDSITVSFVNLSGSDMPVNITFKREAAIALMRLVMRNKDTSDQPYVPRQMHEAWLSGLEAHSIHPHAPKALHGMRFENFAGTPVFSGLNPICSDQLGFALLPRAGSAILVLRDGKQPDCPGHLALELAKQITSNLLPPANNTNTPTDLAEPSTLSGRYISATSTPLWLKERITQMQNDWFTVNGNPEGVLTIQNAGEEPHFYHHKSPYVFETKDSTDNFSTLVFSPFKLGGYALKDQKPYRRIDILGLAALYEKLVPLLIITLLSGAVYSFAMKDRAWRNMGWFAASGATLTATGLYLELEAWPYVLYDYNQAWLINLWRTGLNIGLMAVLTVPMFTVSFSKAQKIPTGALEPMIKIHLLLMSAASMMLMLMLVSWGIAGTFSAY